MTPRACTTLPAFACPGQTLLFPLTEQVLWFVRPSAHRCLRQKRKLRGTTAARQLNILLLLDVKLPPLVRVNRWL